MKNISNSKKDYDRVLSTLFKILDEKENEIGELETCIKNIEDNFENIFNTSYMNENTPIILDTIQHVYDIINSSKIFSLVPELIGKQSNVFWGVSHLIEKFIATQYLTDLNIKYSKIVPTILIPSTQVKKCEIQAINNCDKRVVLSLEEYIIINNEFHKERINIKKIIKSFIIVIPYDIDNQYSIIMPEYSECSNELFLMIKKYVSKQFLLIDHEEKWKKQIFKLLDMDINIIGDDVLLENAVKTIEKPVKRISINNIKENMGNTKFCINFMFSEEILSYLLDIDMEFYRIKNNLSNKISLLKKDSINLQDDILKEKISIYYRRFLDNRDNVERCIKEHEDKKDELIDLVKKYEVFLFEIFKSNNEIYDGLSVETYVEFLLKNYFKYIECKEYKKAQEKIELLKKNGYMYTDILCDFIEYKQGKRKTVEKISNLFNKQASTWEINKIYFEIAKEIWLSEDNMMNLCANIQVFTSGKEYYYYGKYLLDKGSIERAINSFERSLELGYTEAGCSLAYIASNYPEQGIQLDELAEKLIAEVNCIVGIDNLPKKHKKGVVNLKIAASQKHFRAMNVIADLLFNKYKKISWKYLDDEVNIQGFKNTIKIYTELNNIEKTEEYQLRIGIMFCKLGEYYRAFQWLKDLDIPEAQYECAKMLQYGNGMAKDLKMAKLYYEKMEYEYQDSWQKYQKVCEQLNKNNYNNGKNGGSYYQKDQNYETETKIVEQSSDYCFITTAACISLHNSKDSDELNALRWYRDHYLMQDGEDGDELVKEYYRIGPILVQCINDDKDPMAVYKQLWEEYISKTYLYIENDEPMKAKMIYVEMVKMLCEKYHVKVKDSIMSKYNISI